MISIVTSILALLAGKEGVLGQIGDYFRRKDELNKAQLELQNQLLLEKQKMAAELAKADSERATVALGATSHWFKYIVFIMISSPFMACLLNYPDYAQMVFDNLSRLPEWYLIIYTSIIAVIWGIPVKGSIMGFVVEGIKQTRQNQKQYKLQKLNRRIIYEAIRKTDGHVSQDLVNNLEPVLDKIENGAK